VAAGSGKALAPRSSTIWHRHKLQASSDRQSRQMLKAASLFYVGLPV
jgi:hypothetical protein